MKVSRLDRENEGASILTLVSGRDIVLGEVSQFVLVRTQRLYPTVLLAVS